MLLALLLISELATGPFSLGADRALRRRAHRPERVRRRPSRGTHGQPLGAQVGGFVPLGGIVVQLLGARTPVLALDALTFIVSYLFIRTHVRPRPSARRTRGRLLQRLWSDLRLGIEEITGYLLKRPIIVFSWISTIYFSAP